MRIQRVAEESTTITFTPKDIEIRFTPDGTMLAVLWEDVHTSATLRVESDEESEDLQRIADNAIPVMLTGRQRESTIQTKDGWVTVKRFDANAWKEIPF